MTLRTRRPPLQGGVGSGAGGQANQGQVVRQASSPGWASVPLTARHHLAAGQGSTTSMPAGGATAPSRLSPARMLLHCAHMVKGDTCFAGLVGSNFMSTALALPLEAAIAAPAEVLVGAAHLADTGGVHTANTRPPRAAVATWNSLPSAARSSTQSKEAGPWAGGVSTCTTCIAQAQLNDSVRREDDGQQQQQQ